MFNTKCIGMAALILGLSAGAGANAAGASRAEIKTFNVQLIDLDPADGITPAISYDSQTWVEAFVGVYTRTEYHEDFRISYGTLIGAYDSGGAVTTVEPGSMSSEAQSWGIDTLAYSRGAQGLSFWLTPNTAAVFTAEVALALERESGDTALAWLGMSGNVWEGPSFTSELHAPATPLSYAASSTLNGTLESGGSLAMGQLNLWTQASLLTAAPVPEPASWAMLLAGLGLGAATAAGRGARGRRRTV
ncbi:PEP-CTERM sorting domain-containing protein [Massilia sp. Root418]|uniref:PEP-CTERM sorting domain-containing protein n=1 Tax=Massilia sp. Root418 TaxID=1736532 RepID=UPI000B25AF65|nr:PEP-CTERM sorting domain-containing protein [Massilia sp. Root418]